MLRHSEFSGVDWFIFEPRTIRIQEIRRPYTAAPLQSLVAPQNYRTLTMRDTAIQQPHCVTTTADLPGHKPLRNNDPHRQPEPA